jgi:hypothetical protein
MGSFATEKRRRLSRRRYTKIGLIVLTMMILIVMFVVFCGFSYSTTLNFSFLSRNGALRSRERLRDLLEKYKKDPMRESTDRVIFLKTHKTGSSTMGGILSRWAARHGKKACCKRPHVQNEKALNYEIKKERRYHLFLNHYEMWRKMPRDMGSVLSKLHELVPNRASIVSNVREPISHFVSFYNFFIRETRQEPKGGTLYDFAATSTKFRNPLASDFGFKSWHDAKRFLETELKDTTWILQDQYVESLVVLRHKFNWDMEDMLMLKPTYSSSKKSGSFRRYDGNIVQSTESELDNMSPELRAEIERATELDRAFYEYVKEQWIANVPNKKDFVRECKDLRLAIKYLVEICSGQDVPAACHWYEWTDTQYEKRLGESWPGDPWLPVDSKS